MFVFGKLVGRYSFANCKPLDDYVFTHDDNYKWSLVRSWKGTWLRKGYIGYHLNLTSQAWLSDADFSPNSPTKSVWNHILLILVPDEISYKQNATLFITGGDSNLENPEDLEDTKVSLTVALSTNIVTGVLFQIPNAQIIFSSDPTQQGRSEDAITTYTWDHYLKETSTPEWLIYFPMVKASLRAMDTMTEFAAKQLQEKGLQLDYYTAWGASKRGWTTWLVGAVDPNRVVAIVPIVLDAINFVKFSHHQYMSYNGWATALHDYLDFHIMQRLDTPEMKSLCEQIDPYQFRERLTMPKLIINAGGDEFQMPNDANNWWSDMPENKHMLMVPNAEHSLITGLQEALPAVSSWLSTILENKPLPKFEWKIDNETGAITATLDNNGVVDQVNGWSAVSCGINANTTDNRRDWRTLTLDSPCTCGVVKPGSQNCLNLKALWMKTPLQETMVDGKRTYSFHRDPPNTRWVAYFIEVRYKREKHTKFNEMDSESEYESGGEKFAFEKDLFPGFPEFPKDLKKNLVFTTQVSVFPTSYPFSDCVGLPDAAPDVACNNIQR